MAAPKVYQTGQQVLTSLATTDRLLVDNGRPQNSVAPISVLQALLFAASGTFTANGATPVTVANANVTANSSIIITLKTVGGTVGAIPAVQTTTPGTGFTVAGTASDTSIYNYIILG